MTHSQFKTIKTPDGVVLHVYKAPDRNAVPHSIDGPAIKYPKSMKKVDEYFIYGIKYSKAKWMEAKEVTRVTYMPIDPRLG